MDQSHPIAPPRPAIANASRRTVLRRLGGGGLVGAIGLSLGHRGAGAQATPAASAALATLTATWADAWNLHDSARLATLYTADGIHEDLAFDVVVHGPDEIKAWADGFFAASPDLTFELVSTFQIEDRAAAEWVYAGTDQGLFAGRPASGKRYSVRGATIFALREGRIEHGTDYYNLATLQQQLGVPSVVGTPTS